MKRVVSALIILALVVSCTPAIRKDLMDAGIRRFSFADLVKNPGLYTGKLFILGGIVVNTRLTDEGSLVEAVYAPVDWLGDVKSVEMPARRFLALLPKDHEVLDPMIYRKDREVTIAAVFTGTKTGKVDEMEYVFPFFRIRQIHLWEINPQGYCVPYPGPYWGPPYYGGWRFYYYPYW